MQRILLTSILAQLAVLIGSCSAITLFTADSGGNVTTLSLDVGTGKNSSLVASHRTTACATNPSWLTLDATNRILYCIDRASNSAVNGSLNSFSVDDGGALAHIDRIQVASSGVAGEIVTLDSGVRAYVTASYNKSAINVVALGDHGDLPGAGPLQAIFPTINTTGPVISRQDASYSHHVLVDPKNKYILVPDLGGDRIRVFTKDPKTIAPIKEIAGLVTEPGAGPRHAVFKTTKKGETFLFFNGEIDQNIYSYRVEYTKSGPKFTKISSIVSVSADYPATKAPTSEIAISPDQRFIIVSNRDVSFRDSPVLGTGPSDTMSTFAIQKDGSLKLVQLAPSGGWSPRQFSINKAGDLLAIGHQNNNTVVIWKRDITSGKIVLEAEGGKVGQVKLSGAVVSTIFDE